MDFEEVLLKRRSVRSFLDEKVEDDIIDKLLYFAMCGPSACNRQPWEFYVIKNDNLLKEVRLTTPFTNHNAPIAIVIAGNLHKALPLKLQDYWIQDCSSAAAHLLLEATNLGLGSLWCGVYPQKRAVTKLQKALNFPSHIVPLGIFYIGYSDKHSDPRSQYNDKKVHFLD